MLDSFSTEDTSPRADDSAPVARDIDDYSFLVTVAKYCGPFIVRIDISVFGDLRVWLGVLCTFARHRDRCVALYNDNGMTFVDANRILQLPLNLAITGKWRT